MTLRVEALEQRSEQLLLLRRVDERHADRAGGDPGGGLAGGRRLVASARGGEGDRHRDDGEQENWEAAAHETAQKSCCRTRPSTSATAASRARFWFCGRP